MAAVPARKKLYHEVTKAFENNVVHVLPDVLSVCFCDRKFHLMNSDELRQHVVVCGRSWSLLGSYVCLPLAHECPCALFVGEKRRTRNPGVTPNRRSSTSRHVLVYVSKFSKLFHINPTKFWILGKLFGKTLLTF